MSDPLTDAELDWFIAQMAMTHQPLASWVTRLVAEVRWLRAEVNELHRMLSMDGDPESQREFLAQFIAELRGNKP